MSFIINAPILATVGQYVSYWKMDEGTGTVVGDSNTTTANDGAFEGSPTWVTGVKNSSYALALGGTDAVDTFSVAPPGYGTITLWFRKANLASGIEFLFNHWTSTGNRIYIYLDQNSGYGDQVYTRLGGASAVQAFSGGVFANRWTFISFIYGTTAEVTQSKVSCNLSSVNTANVASSIVPESTYLAFGSNYYSGGHQLELTGELANFRCYDRVLSDSDIESIYIQESNRPPTDYIAYWKMDDNSTTLTDSGPHGLDATDQGSTSWDTTAHTAYGRTIVPTLSGGSNYFQASDSDYFTFGNGTTDSPFSVAFWAKAPSTPADFVLKASTDLSGEWSISIDQSGVYAYYVYLQLIDDSEGVYIRRYADTTFSGTKIHHYIATYSGNGSTSGMKIYINGEDATGDASGSVGTYVAMENTTEPLRIGYIHNQFMHDLMIFDRELTAQECYDLFHFIK